MGSVDSGNIITFGPVVVVRGGGGGGGGVAVYRGRVGFFCWDLGFKVCFCKGYRRLQSSGRTLLDLEV